MSDLLKNFFIGVVSGVFSAWLIYYFYFRIQEEKKATIRTCRLANIICKELEKNVIAFIQLEKRFSKYITRNFHEKGQSFSIDEKGIYKDLKPNVFWAFPLDVSSEMWVKYRLELIENGFFEEKDFLTKIDRFYTYINNYLDDGSFSRLKEYSLPMSNGKGIVEAKKWAIKMIDVEEPINFLWKHYISKYVYIAFEIYNIFSFVTLNDMKIINAKFKDRVDAYNKKVKFDMFKQ